LFWVNSTFDNTSERYRHLMTTTATTEVAVTSRQDPESESGKNDEKLDVEQQQHKQKNRTPQVATALHILKGAIVKVLHTPLTTAVRYDGKTRGRLAVEYTHEQPPTEADVKKIETLANEKIKENVPIEIKQMERKAAEEYYRAHPVNETFIYDKYPVPSHVNTLNILTIPDWNVNCVTGPYLSRTGELNGLKILRLNHRPQKRELEFCFELLPASTGKQSPETKVNDSPVPSVAPSGHVNGTTAVNVNSRSRSTLDSETSAAVSDSLSKIVLEELAAILSADTLPPALREEFHQRLMRRFEPLVTAVKNTAYARGFNAARHTPSIDTTQIL
jgi:alanyl-tRNA synthetase